MLALSRRRFHVKVAFRSAFSLFQLIGFIPAMFRIRTVVCENRLSYSLQSAIREARGRRRHPKLHEHFIFQLVPTLGPSTCVQTLLGVRTPQLDQLDAPSY